LVSPPISDHCDLLADSAAERAELLAHVCEYVAREGCVHAEIRPSTTEEPERLTAVNLQPLKALCVHEVPLDAPLDTLFRNLHRNCIQPKFRRAKKEDLIYNSRRSERLLRLYIEISRIKGKGSRWI